jgi:hypothetical protein
MRVIADFRCCAIWGACAILFLAPASAEAALTQIPDARKVISYLGYSDYGGGDVIFSLEANVPGCEDGFWIRASDPGFERNYSTLISAYLSGRPVRVIADNAAIWNGSGGAYCRLYAIGF